MKINQEGLNLLKSFEGCKLAPYKDIGGIWTVGYGHTGQDVIPGQPWTQEQVDNCLSQDLSKFEKGVESLLAVPFNENEFSALVVFSYNVGLNALKNSTLLKKLNMVDKLGAADQLLLWNKVNKQPIAGLTRRRQAERTLFLKQPNSANNGTLLPDGPSDADIMVKLKDEE